MRRFLLVVTSLLFLYDVFLPAPVDAQSGLSGSFFWEERAFAMNYPLVWGFATQLSDTMYAIAPNLNDAENPTPADIVLTIEYLPADSLAFEESGNSFIDFRDGFAEFARTYADTSGIALTLTIEDTDYGYIAWTGFRSDLNIKVALVWAGEDAFAIKLLDPNGEMTTESFGRVMATVLVGEAALTPPLIAGDQTPLSIAPGTPVVGTIGDGIDEQAYVFTAEAGQYLTVQMVANTVALDPLLAVYADRRQIGYNDDALGTYNALVANVALPPARFYTIVATRYSGEGDYTLTITLSATSDPRTWLGDITLQADLTPAETVSDTLGVTDEGHAWRFVAEEGDVITVDMIAPADSGVDPFLYLLDGQGNYLASNDDISIGMNSDAQLSRIRLPADGDYFIIATSFGESAGTYQLTLTREP